MYVPVASVILLPACFNRQAVLNIMLKLLTANAPFCQVKGMDPHGLSGCLVGYSCNTRAF